jgi:hypothetical protein
VDPRSRIYVECDSDYGDEQWRRVGGRHDKHQEEHLVLTQPRGSICSGVQGLNLSAASPPMSSNWAALGEVVAHCFWPLLSPPVVISITGLGLVQLLL